MVKFSEVFFNAQSLLNWPQLQKWMLEPKRQVKHNETGLGWRLGSAVSYGNPLNSEGRYNHQHNTVINPFDICPMHDLTGHCKIHCKMFTGINWLVSPPNLLPWLQAYQPVPWLYAFWNIHLMRVNKYFQQLYVDLGWLWSLQQNFY